MAFFGMSAFKWKDHLRHVPMAHVQAKMSAMPNVHGVNICIFLLLLVTHFIKWVVFGKLTVNEVRNLRVKISYTAWEFGLGFVMLYFGNSQVNDQYLKYGGMFVCVLLLKCFHYLCVDRAFTLYLNDMRFPFVRFAFGLTLLNVVDGLLIYKFIQECREGLGNNILVLIFGFEICNIFPLLVLTTVKYVLNCIEYWRFGQFVTEPFVEQSVTSWKDFHRLVTYVAEFVVNLTRFAMTCMFLVVFLYYYTFPLHILPSSYLSLRVLVLKTRCLIDYRKRRLQLQRAITPSEAVGDCIVCLESMSELVSDVRQLSCSHTLHYSCLSSWINYSPTCPVCRQAI